MGRKWLNIHVLALLSLLVTVVSCDERHIDTDIPMDVRVFSVEGAVYDIQSPDTPIPGVTVTMTAYDLKDTERTAPLHKAVYDTLPDGTYEFHKLWPDGSPDVFYVFSIVDRSSRYQSMERDLYMSAASPFYKSSLKAYEVRGNDFSLSPLSE